MSTGIPGLPPDQGPPPPSQDAQTSSVVDQIRADITADVESCQEPSISFAIPREVVRDLVKFTCGLLREFHAPYVVQIAVAGLVVAPVLAINALLSVTIAVFAPAVAAFVGELLGLLDKVRKELDPEIAQLAVTVLNEFLGTEVNASHMPSQRNFSGHIARADAVGGILHDMLLSEFAGKTVLDPLDGAHAARRFSGLAINFGVATGAIGTIAGMLPEVHLDVVRAIGEDVAKNLGLGRLQRLAMQPLIKTLIQIPYQWLLNQRFHPTQLSVAELVNPFTGALMPEEQIVANLDKLGYSSDKIRDLIATHRKKAPEASLLRAYRYKEVDRSTAIDLMTTLGFDKLNAGAIVTNYERQREDTHVDAIVSLLVDAYKFGQLDSTTLDAELQTLPIFPEEVVLIKRRAGLAQRTPHRSLSVLNLEAAMEQGLITEADFALKLAAFGYSEEDTRILELLTLLKQQKLDAAAAAKAAKAAAKKKATPTPPAVP